MKKIIFAISILSLFACTKEIQTGKIEGNDVASTDSRTIVAEVLSTRTSLDGDGVVLWQAGDKIRVYGSSNADGAVYVTESEGINRATFEAEGTAVEDALRYAVYPADAAASVDVNEGTAVIDFSALAQQEWSSVLDETAHVSALPLVTKSESDKFVFLNTCGGIKVKIAPFSAAGVTLSCLEVRSKGQFSMAGTSSVDLATGQVSIAADGNADKVKVDFGDGLSLIAGSETEVMVFLPSGKYTGGFEFVFTDKSGARYIMETRDDAELDILPGKVCPLEALSLTVWYGKANCYVSSKAETLEIDVTPYYDFGSSYAYSGKVVSSAEGKAVLPASAAILWQFTHPSSGSDVVSSAAIEDGKLKVTTTGVKGNALVAVKNADGQTVWSFHIWCSEVNDLPCQNEDMGLFEMMDRNLGATSTVLKDQASYGNFYQWGRKDPMPREIGLARPSSGDKYKNPYNLVKSEPRNETNGTVAWATANPEVRITGKPGWLAGEMPQLWRNDYKTIFDPCPDGYRVSDGKCFKSNGWKVNKSECDSNYGYTFSTGAGAATTFATIGYLLGTEDNTQYLEYRARYWLSNDLSDQAVFNYNNAKVDVSAYPIASTDSYADGYGVRCVKIK
ncbi:MAG: fimbrillin family protein [Bacteroidales bacterium]|nr:fimbrillin family protein [Bacteroidales bacterium]